MSRPEAPVVSVVLPVRDGMPFLPSAVSSILGQSFTAFELIVVDDGSRDGTPEYLAGLADARVRVMPSPGRGLAAALNAGLAAARGRYLARHDADDRSAPDRFARQVAWLDTHPSVAVLATCARVVDQNDRAVDDEWTRTIARQQDPAQSPAEIRRLMPLTCCLTHGSVMARTQVLGSAGGYDPATVPAEDYDLWLRLLPHHDFAKLPERLYDYRVHASQSGARRREEQTARVIEAKLRFVRRQVPALPSPARLALPCADRGAGLFRKYAPGEGFLVIADEGGPPADVVAVTDFAAVDRLADDLTRRGYRQFGNLFVRPLERCA
ncbi:MAG: glycosyltransferase family 2 protein [Vicinamibacterales bacterium]